jgi:predicted nucleic acid-binding protein
MNSTTESVVVDVDVVSYVFKDDTRTQLYRPHLTGRILVLSFMRVAELERWALKHNWGEARRRRLEEHLRYFVVHPFSRELCVQWAIVSDQAERRGRPISCADAWHAATALLHNVPLITHNRGHFDHIPNLRVMSEAPWLLPDVTAGVRR